MAFLLGAMDNGGEWLIVPDPDATAISTAEKNLIERFDRVAHTGSLVCAMGAINHYAINHTTGQGRLQGFRLKTARILSLPYSNERLTATEDTRRQTTGLLYAAAHPVSKRNMLFVLDDKIVNLRAAWVPGIPRPAHGCADQFLSVRIGGVPAGVRKIYVALEACRKIANSGLLCAMPGAAVVRKLNEDMKVMKESGVSCHVGAILSQIDDNNEEHPVGFFSRKLLPREQQYATVEKECLAIKLGVEAFKVYLLGRSFTILTDHRALEWLERLKGNNNRLTRWSLSLQPYSFTVKFRKGISNQNADALSHLFGEDGQGGGECKGLTGMCLQDLFTNVCNLKYVVGNL